MRSLTIICLLLLLSRPVCALDAGDVLWGLREARTLVDQMEWVRSGLKVGENRSVDRLDPVNTSKCITLIGVIEMEIRQNFKSDDASRLKMLRTINDVRRHLLTHERWERMALAQKGDDDQVRDQVRPYNPATDIYIPRYPTAKQMSWVRGKWETISREMRSFTRQIESRERLLLDAEYMASKLLVFNEIIELGNPVLEFKASEPMEILVLEDEKFIFIKPTNEELGLLFEVDWADSIKYLGYDLSIWERTITDE